MGLDAHDNDLKIESGLELNICHFRVSCCFSPLMLGDLLLQMMYAILNFHNNVMH